MRAFAWCAGSAHQAMNPPLTPTGGADHMRPGTAVGAAGGRPQITYGHFGHAEVFDIRESESTELARRSRQDRNELSQGSPISAVRARERSDFGRRSGG